MMQLRSPARASHLTWLILLALGAAASGCLIVWGGPLLRTAGPAVIGLALLVGLLLPGPVTPSPRQSPARSGRN